VYINLAEESVLKEENVTVYKVCSFRIIQNI